VNKLSKTYNPLITHKLRLFLHTQNIHLEGQNGTHLKINNINFGHIHQHNRKIVTSPKTKINFYHPSMTRQVQKLKLFFIIHQ